ncbi:hypothetical protein B9Z55_015561 [Caenorhabditis nigoni]|uniref:F-box domain-containing protein n=1 Tax=Caenorhabditis nigoni TaxID=1611254 RepID=A0A2G5UAR2_9PELO|nr:hypothetical protein B9Z55_015561 [Caenorhabditis nigoni]
MNEPPTNPKFGFQKCPFALREEIIRNMEFMDAFHFSTLSKRSKRMVHDAKLPTHSISFYFSWLGDMISVETIKDGKRFAISLSDTSKRDPEITDGVKLASLINEPSDDYRKKLSAHLLSIFPFKETVVFIDREIEPLTEFFLWDVRKTFNFVTVGWGSPFFISSEDLIFMLETIKSNRCNLGIKIDGANFKCRKALKFEQLSAFHSVQWLDTDDFLKRNPKMKHLHLEDLYGEQINDLLKQWINGQVTDLESLIALKRHEQAKQIYSRQEVNGQLMNIQRKIDGQLATVLLDQKECSVVMWNEKRLAELGN